MHLENCSIVPMVDVMESVEIEFPVIAFVPREDNYFYIFRSADDLSSCTQLAYEVGFFIGMKIIDANGNLLEVESSIKRNRGWIIEILDRVTNGTIVVDIKCRYLRAINLEEIKSMMLLSIDVNIDRWSVNPGDAARMRMVIERSSDLEEIMAVTE